MSDADSSPPRPSQDSAAGPDEPAEFARRLPPQSPVEASTIVEQLDFSARSQARPASERSRPYLVLNMASTVDGRASIDGRSGAIGNRADRELFHALRDNVDAVMAGAGTVRVERYGRIIGTEPRRRARVERGLSAEPLACVVSGRLALPLDVPLLREPEARVVIVTPSAASLPETPAHVEYVRAGQGGELDIALAMRELHTRFGVQTLLCEGGPHLNAQLLLAGVVDELFLSFAPKLAGGEDATGEALRIVAGAAFATPIELELLAALENESHLFLRYGVRSPAPERA
ncbi:MAG TPA: dihydrofolate reductase family protein [Solirubrobacteraceae bacterium]